MNFSEKKWTSLPLQLQHKKCAELLRSLWHGGEYSQYRQLILWMGASDPGEMTKEEASDRYHWHLSQAGINIREHDFLPQISSQDHATSAKSLEFTVYLDRIRSAHNVGSIIRTMEAFSLGELVLSEGMADPTHKQVRDAAMGAEQWVPWKRGNLSDLPRPLVAIETSPDATPLHLFTFAPGSTIALGNEEFGLSKEILSEADELVEIPLFGHKNSLNVANCFAIVAAHLRSSTTE